MITEAIKILCIAEGVNSAHRHKRLAGEVFTPTALVLEALEKLPDEMWEEGRTFCDAQCGNGQALVAAAIIKREIGHKWILETIYGTDLMQDNIDECHRRLLAVCGDTEYNRSILQRNVRCEDALQYDYKFL